MAATIKIGRPARFESPEELEAKLDLFIEEVQKGLRKPTITGLAFYLGFESRQSFYDYEEREAFSYTIKRARLFIEMTYEENLSGTTATGSIFALKNMGWSDKMEGTLNVGGMTVVMQPAQGCEPIPSGK